MEITTDFDNDCTGRRARMFYAPQVATVCDICEGDDCRKVCGGKTGSQAGEEKGSATSLSVSYLTVLFLFGLTLRGL